MAIIKPFKPIRPNPFFVDQLVFTKPQAESVSGHRVLPLKTLLEENARSRPETPEGQEQAYQDIRENLRLLLAGGQLWEEKTAGYYVYEVVHKGYRQTGIWALTALTSDAVQNIRLHELTFADSVRRIRNYREYTGLEGSPILLAYPAVQHVNAMIEQVKAEQPKSSLGNQYGLHRLWKIEETGMQQALAEAFSKIPTVYLADGHHRLEAAALSSFKHISSLYMGFDQLRIEPYDRIVIPDRAVSIVALFGFLRNDFYLQEVTGNLPVRPGHPGNFGMCINGEWYHLKARDHSAYADAAILQERVLAPFFGISDPKTDSRLKCAGGEKALEEIGAIFQAHPGAIAFTLCPLSVAELVRAADAGRVLPPKSTWIVPKIPYGLLIHNIEKI
ncbi:DUF1015 family protein [Mucilaginibacter sp.]|uniref:DUF1015 family protein n=1 Tax=Mucilaginibacter sp. TaxID=1882438 RepID=UPI0028411140|nr:DUF1015 family protein [Mucilaginibacter sp.]MDR3695397.1 DUF1015 family protein [Mucilaginibacter sp.]